VLENTPLLTLNIDGNHHTGFRDLDDQTCTVFEAHTIRGDYLWIPHHTVKKIEVSKPTRLVDHLWSKARVKLTDDTDLVVYFPGIYFSSFGSDIDDSLRLGRETIWKDDTGLDVGFGRRIFGAGDEEFTLFDFENVTLEVAS
jgi:protein involved in temperature-dependent protein secretion